MFGFGSGAGITVSHICIYIYIYIIMFRSRVPWGSGVLRRLLPLQHLLAPATFLAPVTARACYCLRLLLPVPTTACACCFRGHAMLLQRSRTLQLLLLVPRNASATLPDAATAASWPLQRSCNTPRRCNCCFWGRAPLLQRSWTLQLLLPGLCNAPATLLGAAAAAPLSSLPG